ncbi:sigma 54-interacting transcriptional regulator [uncultured Muribaculum sp.]|jgi:two-component system response regulator HydG|uniref:sigma-54-dependent transcriptional regulator n=1 Tax=uncultured Muribaculum sp. TaxID=1918613 RepID=UPI0025B230E8|nr:sigma 54-interacting transcriptional regulator [uncultured Muribaculum sp.]
MNKILIVDANPYHLSIMFGLLEKAGYEPVTADSMKKGKEEVAKLPPGGVIVSAINLHGVSVVELIEWMKARGYKFPVLVIVDNLNAVELVEVMSDWKAVNIIQRPAIDKQLIEFVRKYAKKEKGSLNLGKQLLPRLSKEWQEIGRKIGIMAKSNANVIVFGASGTGKEQVALQVYLQSVRSQKPYIVIEAGGAGIIGEHDLQSGQSEIYTRIKNYFLQADGGTIIVKNLHLLNLEKQSVLLHILQEEHPDVRVICTAEPYLQDMVMKQTFRTTLLYMLKEYEIAIPSISDVTEDIPVLADTFLRMYADDCNEKKKRLDSSALKELRKHPWIGNVRELKNVIIQAALDTLGDTITASDLTLSVHGSVEPAVLPLKCPNEESRRITDALTKTRWNKTQASELLNISRNTLNYKIKQYGLVQN